MGLIRKKINDVNGETNKLRKEIDQQNRDSSTYSQLERRYETLIKNKESLEGELADYNLALDKTRTSTGRVDRNRFFTFSYPSISFVPPYILTYICISSNLVFQ